MSTKMVCVGSNASQDEPNRAGASPSITLHSGLHWERAIPLPDCYARWFIKVHDGWDAEGGPRYSLGFEQASPARSFPDEGRSNCGAPSMPDRSVPIGWIRRTGEGVIGINLKSSWPGGAPSVTMALQTFSVQLLRGN